MGFSYNVNVLNQKGSPALYTDTFANRPAFGYAGRLFIANDTSAIYEDTGTAWVLIANVSSGAGTLQQVTTNGNTSNVGISVTAGGISTNSLTDTALTLGSVPFTGTGGLISQDNANFFWDDTNNRLGINTNTPGNTLDVHTAGTNPILALNNTAGNQSAISFLNTGIGQWRIGNKATTNTLDIFNFILNNHAIRINNGDNSIEITNLINVQSNGSIMGSNANGSTPLRIQANNVQNAIQFINAATGTANLNIAGTSTTSAFYFSTYSTVNALRIENSGAVLVNNPSDDGVNKLQVNGGLKSTTATLSGLLTSNVTSGNISIAANATTGSLYTYIGNSIGNIFTGVESNAAGAIFPGTSANASIIGSTANTSMQFVTNNSVKTTLTSVGNLLIGTTVDTFDRLLVQGDIVAQGGLNVGFFSRATNNNTTYGFYNDAGGNLTLTNSGVANRGNFNMATGVYTPISDINQKKDIEISQIGLNAILNLKPSLYRMISENENSDKHLGFIAQDVKDFIPQAFVKNNDFIGLDYQAITSTLVKAIQEQQSIIDSLLKRIELLENK